MPKSPLFEVRQNGERKYYTNSVSGIYDVDLLKSMQKAGCTFRVNGKSCRAGEVHKSVNEKSKRPE